MVLHPVQPPTAVDDTAVYAAELNPHWTIGPKIHGGVMLALCAKAASSAVGVAAAVPLAVSASFVWAPDPGQVWLTATVRKRGRQVNLVDVELSQQAGDIRKVAVRAVVTVGVAEGADTPLLATDTIAGQMTPEPPDHVEAIGPGHPLAEITHLAAGCEIRPDMTGLWNTAPGQTPATRIWVRPRGERPDLLFALMCGDISMPVTFAVGRTGWAPTVQLTAYLRGIPADGWLRVSAGTTQIGATWFDEDHTVVDSAGRLIVQTRQLALVPAP